MVTRGVHPNTTAEFNIQYFANHDRRVMQALVTAGALVALADGRVDAIERNELVNFIDRQGFIPTISRRCIGKTFDDRWRTWMAETARR
jgi:tellurite resistance protein